MNRSFTFVTKEIRYPIKDNNKRIIFKLMRTFTFTYYCNINVICEFMVKRL